MTIDPRGWFAPADRYALRLLLLVSTVIVLWQPVFHAARRKAHKLDPWGEAYRISIDASRGWWEVRCAGPDRRAHTGDDIVRTGSAR